MHPTELLMSYLGIIQAENDGGASIGEGLLLERIRYLTISGFPLRSPAPKFGFPSLFLGVLEIWKPSNFEPWVHIAATDLIKQG